MSGERPSTLARYLFVVYVLLVVYASLHPFSGWRDRGLPPFTFLTAPLARPIPAFDFVANIIGYVPLGFLAVLAAYPRLRLGYAFAFSFACSASLSFALESLQLYLPTRTSSNLDLLANTAGGLVGALTALAAMRPLIDAGGLQRLRNRLFLPGGRIDLGLVLLGLWLFAQLNPETLLFGTGDLRDLFKAPSGKLYPAEVFLRVEAGVACANGLAAGLLASCLIERDQPTRGVVVFLMAAALAAHSFGFGLLISSQEVLSWVTPGALYGVAGAIVLLMIAVGLPRTAQLALVGLTLLAATAIVNLAPANPYNTATLSLWQQGHYLNFNGLTRVVSIIWPFAAMFYSVLLAAAHEQARPYG
ncbi:MAG TPA: VanZ family protein [Burkholderiales bacterium]|nr:VanZ family protein [Burkholderiales bacterium]